MSDFLFDVVVEIPKGSRNKYELDHRTGRFRFDRMLFSALHYPTDYGFIDDTLGEDGDPLDALVLVWEPTFPGCVIEASPLGVFKMEDEKGHDHKILSVPVSDPIWSSMRRLSDVPAHLLKEIEHFFAVYKDLENKPTTVSGWESREAAETVIREARSRFSRERDGTE